MLFQNTDGFQIESARAPGDPGVVNRMILRIIFVSVLITFSYLIYSCVSTTANRSLKAWKRQPGTSTYISPEHNIKVTFPNNEWRIYTGPEEGSSIVKKSWRKYRSEYEMYHGLMAIHPDGGGIIMQLKILPSEQPVLKYKLDEVEPILPAISRPACNLPCDNCCPAPVNKLAAF